MFFRGSQTIRAFNKQTSFIQRFEEYLDWANNTELIIKGVNNIRLHL